jgi:hypothetical protein
VVLTPLLLYGVFNVYRSKANPRAKFSELLVDASARQPPAATQPPPRRA